MNSVGHFVVGTGCEFRFKMAETIDKRNAESKEDKTGTG